VGTTEKFINLRRTIVQGVHLEVVEHSKKDTPDLLNTLREKDLQGVH